MRRIAVLGVLFALASAGVADQGWVANRGGTTISVFDPATNTELPGSPITVGTAPVDIASDQPDGVAPTTLFVANSGSGDVALVDAASKVVVGIVTGDSTYGTFLNPSGITRTHNGFIAVVDEKVVGAQKSTVRFLHPATGAVIDGFIDPTSTARYVDVVSTANGRLWVADDGYDGIVVLHLGGFAGPTYPAWLNRTIQFSGLEDYADVIWDNVNSPKQYLINPQRLATNGTDRVVVADTGSDVVTILDANYPSGATSVAIVANVDLGLASGKVCTDVEIAGTKIYVTTTDPAAPVKIVSLTTGAVLPGPSGSITTTVGGIGRAVDGSKVYVGGGVGIATIYEINTTTDAATIATAGFSGGSFPFGFVLAPTATLPGPSGMEATNDGCGLLGLEAALLLGLLAVRRRRHSPRDAQKSSSSSPQ
ncbi:MAG: hypothetical protein HYY17_09030 [Planctomycetes bacterium]|nr:hypothetical protein [Planctomycetota bacterium]